MTHKPKFPLPDVTLKQVTATRRVTEPAYADEFWQISQTEFAMQVEGVGEFYVCNGTELEYSPSGIADPDWVNLYLNGHVLVALLHQRKIINFHAASLIYQGKGLMILGETGAGKSSLTASFSLDGSKFMSDDLTPVIFNDGKPVALPIHKTIKLRPDSIKQMEIGPDLLIPAESGTGKYYLKTNQNPIDEYTLDYIIKIEIGKNEIPLILEPDIKTTFSILRSEICSWEMLKGMHETETTYLQHLIDIINHTTMIRIVRPENIRINDLYRFITDYLSGKHQ